MSEQEETTLNLFTETILERIAVSLEQIVNKMEEIEDRIDDIEDKIEIKR